MRTTLMTFILLISVASASTIDWTRLEMEMDYLESNKKTNISELKTQGSNSSALDTLSLRRKAIDEKEGIIDLEPLFDEVNLKQASPVKEKQKVDKNKPRLDGSISKDAFEGLVD